MKPRRSKTVRKGSPEKKNASRRSSKTRDTTTASSKILKSKPSAKTFRGSKRDIIIDRLRAAKGAALDELVGATGWQKHSVRGFLAGVVRKQLGLKLVSEKLDGLRRYRIET